MERSARLALRLANGGRTDLELVLEVVPFTTDKHPTLAAEVWANGQRVAQEVFRYEQPHQTMRIPLALDPADDDAGMDLELRLRDPARPLDLGVGSDPRRLGLCLRSLAIVEAGTDVAPEPDRRRLGKLRRQLSRPRRG